MTEKSRSNQKTVAILMSIVLIAALVLSFSLFLQKNTLQQNVDKLTADLKVSEEKVTALTAEKAALDEAAKAAQTSADETNAKLTALQTELDAAKAELETAKAELETAKADAQVKQEALDAAAKDQETAAAAANTLNEELAAAKKAAEDATAQVAALEAEKAALTEEKAALETNAAELTQKAATLETEKAALQEAVEAKAVSRVATAVQEGFAGPVEVVVTVDEAGKIIALTVGDHETFKETQDIGAKVKEEAFSSQFLGKTGPFELGKDVDTVSGATWSSRAVVNAVNAALAALEK